MIVYLDENNIVHKEYKEGYTQAQHPFFDSVPELALSCYKFIPEKNFIQCINSEKEILISQQAMASEIKYNSLLQNVVKEMVNNLPDDVTELHFSSEAQKAIESAEGYSTLWGKGAGSATIYFDV